MYSHHSLFLTCIIRSKNQQQQGKRDLEESGALSFDSVNKGLDVGTKGVGLISGLTDVADKLKHLITGKRDGEVHPAILGAALAHIL